MVHIYPSYSNYEFLLYDYVPTQISFGRSLSPLHFICSVQASTVTPSLQQLLTLLSVIHVIRWYLYFISLNMISLLLVYMFYIRATAEDEDEVMTM